MLLRLRYLLYSAGSLAWAGEPIVLPLGKIGEKELSAVLPSDKWMILLMVCGQIIWALYSEIRKAKEKKENKDSEKLDRLFNMVHKIQGQLKNIKQAPTETEIVRSLDTHIKLAVLEAMRKYQDKGKL